MCVDVILSIALLANSRYTNLPEREPLPLSQLRLQNYYHTMPKLAENTSISLILAILGDESSPSSSCDMTTFGMIITTHNPKYSVFASCHGNPE